MNGSTLIFGSNKKARKEKILEIVNKSLKQNLELSDFSKNVDIMVIKMEKGSKSIGIADIREAILFLQQKPFSLKNKFLLVFDAEKLTVQAQNALLKTLEEPPSYVTILLSSKLQNSLLETVISRCRQVQIKTKKSKKEVSVHLKRVLKMSLGERLDEAYEISKEEKENIINTLEIWIEEERDNMLKAKIKQKHANNIKKIIKIKDNLEKTNVNPRLSLETLLLSLSKN